MIKFHVEESDRIVKFAINSQSTDLLDCLSPTTIKTQATHTPITRILTCHGRLVGLLWGRRVVPIGVLTPIGAVALASVGSRGRRRRVIGVWVAWVLIVVGERTSWIAFHQQQSRPKQPIRQ
jgi:hypothetical protein